MSNFVNLHVQSHYSVLNAVPTIDELVDRATELNQSALALTDHNCLFGVPEFLKKTKNKIHAIYGLKLDIMQESRFSSQRKEDIPIQKFTIILLAKNFNGYQNILKLSSQAYDDGSYGRFCADKQLLRQFSEDIIVLSSDYSGELYYHALKKNSENLAEAVTFYQETFGRENFYIEIQDRGTQEDKIANKTLIEFAQSNQIPLVATNPVKYIHEEDHILYEIVCCIREKELIQDSTPTKGRAYLKSYEEMLEIFKEIPEALENTVKIAEQCIVEFPKVEDQSPQYPVPENMTPESYLKEKSFTELTKKFKGDLPIEYKKRLEWELDTVCSMGFPNYFLVVSDFVQYAKKNGILVGPGRGSAAGALLSYALDITNVDPLRYDLLFERFLNPERVSMPDIDIDFEDDRRDEVKQYLRTHYGHSRTADVVTFGYNKAKAVLKDVGRVLDIPLFRVNQISGMVDANADLESQSQEIGEIKTILEGNNQREKFWIDYSIKLANRIRNLGTHASALIVAKQALYNIIPLFKDRSNTMTTSFEGKYLEENGLLKMDILGLSNLTIIKECLDRIYQNHQIWINLDEISLEDEKVFQMFTDGFTAGIFQFESQGMTNYIKQLKPTSIEDLIAMNALYRPGPMDNIPSFIDRKQGREPIDCFHENLEPILKTTYGVIVYQEQVMQVAQILSGFSLGEADVVRRIMAKKKPDELETVRPQWINGAVERGYEAKLAENLFEKLLPFSNYAFNKSHAAAYSILAYQIAWLKTHYPAEFMASLMSSNMGRHEDIQKYITETKKINIQTLVPDINKSYFKFHVELLEDKKYGIRYGLGAIKGLGEQAMNEIIKEREWGGEFDSVENFVERTAERSSIRKASLEILLRAGAFDSLLDSKNIMQEKALYLNAANLDALYKKFEKKEENITGMNLFGAEEMAAATTDNFQKTGIPALSFEEDFHNEMRVFGFYFTEKIFQAIQKNIGVVSTYTDILKEELPIGVTVSSLGYINDIHIAANHQIPKRSWGRFSLNTENDTFSFFLFGEKLSRFEGMLKEGSFAFVKMKISYSNKKETKEYDLENLLILKEDQTISHNELHIYLHNDKNSEEFMQWSRDFQKLAKEDYRNDAVINIIFHIHSNSEIITKRAGNTYRVKKSKELFELLNHKFVEYFWFL